MAKVRVTKRGRFYQYQLEIAKVNGKRKYITKSGFRTKQEAEKEGTIVYSDYYNRGKYRKETDMSYSDFLDYWIDNYAKVNLKYATISGYSNIIKNHIKPKLGDYKLTQIDARMLQEMINNVYIDNSYSKCYISSILKVIKGTFKYACYILNYINDDPAERVHLPRMETINHDPAHIFTPEEIERILNRFKDTHSIYYSFLTAYYTGMRVSEVYALTWDCVDFENKTININKNIIKKNQRGLPKKPNITKGHSAEEWYYGSCKNPQSNRVITIGDTLVNALKDYKKEQEENKKFYGDSYLLHYEKKVLNPVTNKPEIKIVDAKAELDVNLKLAPLVFVKDNGQYMGTETDRYAFKVIHYELGIPSRFHDFRDTHATRLIESGADIKAVSKRLGHSTIMTTYNIYVRVTNKMETDTVKRFEDYSSIVDIPETTDKPYIND